MEMRQLQTFRVVTEMLSFTKAAQKLHMAQSSVSAQIKSLEDNLQVKLFDRIGRRVLVTEPGLKLYEYARRMADMTREIRSEISRDKDTKGALRIRVPETLASVYMPEIITRFHQSYPNAGLTFINCTDQQLREELNSGRIDLAFLLTDTVQFKEVNIKMLKAEKLVLIAHPNHSLAKKKGISLKDLEGHTALLPRTD